jgi:ketosteroid isomerase-like protein
MSLAPALLLVLLSTPPPESDRDVPELLRRQTQELVDAIGAGDASVWERYLDPDVRCVDESGEVMTKAKMIADLRPLPQGVSGSIRVTGFDAVVHAGVAVATYVDDENEDFHGNKVHCPYRTTDTWRRTPDGWRLIASQVLALRTDPPAVPLPATLRREYCGRYALTPSITYEIRCDGDALEGQQTGRKPETLRAEAPDMLFVPGRPRYRKVFLRDADGRITAFAERREAWDIVWTRLPG